MWRLLLISPLVFLCTTQAVQAASLYIDPGVSVMNPGDARQFAVRLNVDRDAGECVNVIDATIQYSESISPVDISIGDSIFTIWVEEPTINTSDRTITFAGGLPNGYCGRVDGDPRLTNNILEIVMRAPGFSIGTGGTTGTTTAELAFLPETTVLLNDGRGTPAELETFGAEIALTGERGSGITDTWRSEVAADTIPPQAFSIALERSDSAFGGQYFIVFNTTDKQTGIDEYQVIEEPLNRSAFGWGRADAPWITARSPYVLQDQSLNSTIRVRAIDKAGNEYIATLLPDETLRQRDYTEYVVFGTIAVVTIIVLVGGFVGYRLWRRRSVIHEVEDVYDENN